MKRAPAVPSGISSFCGVRERLDILRAGFDRGGFEIRVRVGMVRLDKADVVEEKLVAARRAELAAS